MLLDSLGDCRTVYFCGLAKNAGKTVALRQTCVEARARGQRLAVTSVGRDGEAFDAVYDDFPKPRLPFDPGDLMAKRCKRVHAPVAGGSSPSEVITTSPGSKGSLGLGKSS
jgi:hypothetical protein